MNNAIDKIITNLNQAQHEAVTAKPANLLILAGAGSGKTRVLVHRIAWLICTENVSPHSILAVTFTNKAAKEMQHRIEQLLGISARSLWIGTFHGLAHRLLRIHWQLAELPQNFQILDSDDQLRTIKKIQKELNIDDTNFPPRQTQYYINNQKDQGLRYKDLAKTTDRSKKYLQEIYKTYERQCQQFGLVDFAEIILRARDLLANNHELRQHYQNRFQHVLVDEFQDTNSLQYHWLRLFYNNNNYFTMVGDDDQSIYGWRGAKVENIKKFCADYHNSKTIRLEQNYRSTANILNAANSLIANNQNRLGKDLWTDGKSGDLITVYHAYNDIDEAKYVVEQIKNLHRQGMALSDMAVLYRANHQSRQFEENLLRTSVPYKIFGGQRFFDRAEIKDTLAYLRLISNPFDDTAFDRIINWPTRGIGKQSLVVISDYAKMHNLTLMHALEQVISLDLLKNKAKLAVVSFVELINLFKQAANNLNLAKLVELVIDKSGLRDYYYKEDKSKDKTKIENLDELITACYTYEQEFNSQSQQIANQDLTLLQSFLSHAVLEAGEMQYDKNDLNNDCLNLMTIHTAKGLEFKVVFIVGLEEGLFPHEMCLHDKNQLAEERRLCYVAITRAREKLYLSFCEVRRLRGDDRYNLPSRFLKEIPSELIKLEQVTTYIERSNSREYNKEFSSNKSSSNKYNKAYVNNINKKPNSTANIIDHSAEYKLWQTVKHDIFGLGVILSSEGYGDKARVQVKFKAAHGTKWLIAKIAKLEIV